MQMLNTNTKYKCAVQQIFPPNNKLQIQIPNANAKCKYKIQVFQQIFPPTFHGAIAVNTSSPSPLINWMNNILL